MNDTTVSIPLADLSLGELIAINQGMGHDIERIREKRKYLQAKIAERIAAGEPEHPAAAGDAVAPGAVIAVSVD